MVQQNWQSQNLAYENKTWMNNGDNSLNKGIQEILSDTVDVVVFNEEHQVFGGTYTPTLAEINILKDTFQDRNKSVKNGLLIQGIRYEVQRWHPPLVYGRNMYGDPTTARGVAIMKVDEGINGKVCYV
eukprot:TRINITY_DN15753_c0_g1_i5.p3 TRINITY_DN15753_c0_g1~~TRINITY_DN15753_c0_g1_i5.p3  ORF type:complete len:128 (-),score=12.40 TRINITY_DN15753_c0_g1_i5:61-444(-)